MTIGERLKGERQRLGLNQQDFAKIAGAAKRTQIDWEKGTSSPNANALAAFGEAGVDVNYVVTGVRAGSTTGALISPASLQLGGGNDSDGANGFRLTPVVFRSGFLPLLSLYAPKKYVQTLEPGFFEQGASLVSALVENMVESSGDLTNRLSRSYLLLMLECALASDDEWPSDHSKWLQSAQTAALMTLQLIEASPGEGGQKVG